MSKLQVQSAHVYQGPSYMENTEDGPQAVFDSFAAVVTVDGREFQHIIPFRSPRDAALLRLISRIEAAGVIDTDRWIEFPPRMSLEERFAMYAQRESEVRHGFRDEEDMYHGLD